MPLKTNVGISRKVADSNYGSRGASVSLEVELDSSLIQEPERFQDRIRQVFRLAQQAVDDELARQQKTGSADGPPPAVTSNGNGHNGTGHTASEKQLAYARQLAGQIKGLGVRGMEATVQKMFSKPLTAITTLEASGLIEVLKDIKAGKIDLAVMRNGSEA
jgi:hypothetical protein